MYTSISKRTLALLSTLVLLALSLMAPVFLPWLTLPLILLILLILVSWLLPLLVESRTNRVRPEPALPASREAHQIHSQLFIADLHADPLMWNRDLLRRHSYGHIDLPRLVEGNVALQVFGVVTQSPPGQNFEKNASNKDQITPLVICQGWPLPTWNSRLQRAVYQAARLEGFVARAEGKLVSVRSVQDLETLQARRAKNEKIVGGFLGLEGVHALDGRVENLELLFASGFRMIGLTHFFDNEAGGSAHGIEKSGLTPFGKQVVRRVQELHMVLDLAHASPQVIDDALEITAAPVVVSHTGVRGTCDNRRNLSDDQARRIAATGGVMGIALFDTAVCGPRVEDTAHAIRYLADLVGVEHAALGSDFDGSVMAPIDASGWPSLTEALLKEGFNAGEIAGIMGLNALRVFMQVFPR
jgi:microsomal dipeptidase-like Zn-dependent dipeptidase